jgi:micrococcal nuclease
MRSTRDRRLRKPSRFKPRLDPRSRRRDRVSKRLITPRGLFGLTITTAIFIAGVVLANWSQTERQGRTEQRPAVQVAMMSPVDEETPALSSGAVSAVAETFSRCGLNRRTCVVDGDTIWLDGQKVRIADIDTPEVSQPSCAAEKALGERATDRLVFLLNEGPFEVRPIGSRDEDQYGRKLRVIERAGRSLGDQLVAEGLARTWTGRRQPWC